MKPKTNDRQIQLSVIESVYETKNKSVLDQEGHKMKDMFGSVVKEESKRFLKENHLKVWVYKEDIRLYGEYTGANKNKLKTRCLVFNSASNSPYIVNHSLEELHQAIHENQLKKQKIGFNK